MQIRQYNIAKTQHLILLIVILGFIPLLSMAQAALKKGEQIPDIVLQNIYNYPKKAFDLNQIRGKLIIFDFWSPSCISCLKSFPKIDSLQRLFANEVTIVLVNKESLDSTRRFFETRKFLFRPEIPFATSDVTINKLFPNRANPAYAWIDGEGKFHQMTNELTAASIRRFLAENKVNLEDYRERRKYLTSLFDREYESSVISYSYLSKAIPGVNLNGSIGKNGLSFHNYDLLNLYREAFGEQGKYDFSKKWNIVLDVNDTQRFISPEEEELAHDWKRKNLYNYALLLPENMAEERFSMMRSDLKRYLGFDARVEKKLISSMILVKVGNTDKLKSNKTGPSNFRMSDIRTSQIDSVRRLINRPFKTFSNILGSWVALRLEKPFVDETGYSGNIDIELNGNALDSFNLGKIRAQLKQYGLDLIEQKRPIDVLVIREKGVVKE